MVLATEELMTMVERILDYIHNGSYHKALSGSRSFGQNPVEQIMLYLLIKYWEDTWHKTLKDFWNQNWDG